MLKIKEGIDLKELEKFGYSKTGNEYRTVFNMFGNIGNISINTDTRTMKRTAFFDTRTEVIDTDIYDLIQAGLVEKVEV